MFSAKDWHIVATFVFGMDVMYSEDLQLKCKKTHLKTLMHNISMTYIRDFCFSNGRNVFWGLEVSLISTNMKKKL
jgi:hypothetical protein